MVEQQVQTSQVLAMSPAIDATLASFAAALESRKLRRTTIDTYTATVGRFRVWLGDDATIADIRPDTIARYQQERRSMCAATIAKELTAIRCFCRWTIRARLRADDPTLDLEFPRKRKRLPRPLKAEELEQLEAILEKAPPLLDVKARRLWFRNRRIVLVLLYTGLRRSEVAGLVWDDVYLREQQLIVRSETAKGGSERIVPLHPRVVTELATTPPAERRGALAGHPDGRCLSHKSIGAIFERWLATQGLRISAHKLRHSCATELLRAGAGLREVQATLGHADVRTTEGYAALIPERQRAAIERLPARFG